ncbi:MAG: type II toxin-antitoxin system RelE/ParE family toxin [Rhodomicrobium sp.]
MRLFKLRTFARFARREAIDDSMLAGAIRDAERGLAAVDLGGGLIKLRIARPGKGKRGGYRTIVAYAAAERAAFLFGFAKSDLDTISPDRLDDLKAIGAELLGASDAAMDHATAAGMVQEVEYGQEDRSEHPARRGALGNSASFAWRTVARRKRRQDYQARLGAVDACQARSAWA